MLFNKENYPTIKSARQNRQLVEFKARIEDTGFESSDVEVPSDWKAFSPAIQSPEGYAQIFAHADSGVRGELIRLELLVHLDGGQVLYKSSGENLVAIKVIWPEGLLCC